MSLLSNWLTGASLFRLVTEPDLSRVLVKALQEVADGGLFALFSLIVREARRRGVPVETIEREAGRVARSV